MPVCESGFHLPEIHASDKVVSRKETMSVHRNLLLPAITGSAVCFEKLNDVDRKKK